jgi:hypothetical protein
VQFYYYVVSRTFTINIGIANLFTDADVQSDYIQRKSRDFLPLLGAFDVLNIKKLLRLLKP